MTEPLASAAMEVRVDHHMFYLLDEGASVHPYPLAPNGLVVSEPGLAVILTGAAGGLVNVAVEVWRHAPPSPETHRWDEIVEHSVLAPTGTLRVAPLDGDPLPGLPVLAADGPGEYRLRVHARGRDTAPDAVAFEPVEDYLIQAWPASAAADTIYQQRDRYGAERRSAPVAASRPSTDHSRPKLPEPSPVPWPREPRSSG